VSLGSYRYLRYRGAPGSYCTLVEIQFYRAGVKLKEPDTAVRDRG